jgi:segregation and condensation protein A
MSETGENRDQDELWPDGEGPVRLMPEPEDESQPLIVDVAGFEGPLDLLLQMARSQKVDITRISILALAEQYLMFIEDARRMKLEIAADYLVMAAWLAYLKSRLLLPKEDTRAMSRRRKSWLPGCSSACNGCRPCAMPLPS